MAAPEVAYARRGRSQLDVGPATEDDQGVAVVGDPRSASRCRARRTPVPGGVQTASSSRDEADASAPAPRRCAAPASRPRGVRGGSRQCGAAQREEVVAQKLPPSTRPRGRADHRRGRRGQRRVRRQSRAARRPREQEQASPEPSAARRRIPARTAEAWPESGPARRGSARKRRRRTERVQPDARSSAQPTVASTGTANPANAAPASRTSSVRERRPPASRRPVSHPVPAGRATLPDAFSRTSSCAGRSGVRGFACRCWRPWAGHWLGRRLHTLS